MDGCYQVRREKMPRIEEVDHYTTPLHTQPKRNNTFSMGAIVNHGGRAQASIENLRKLLLQAQTLLDDNRANLSPKIRQQLVEMVTQYQQRLQAHEETFATTMDQCLRRIGC
jgi:hypothetical protein